MRFFFWRPRRNPKTQPHSESTRQSVGSSTASKECHGYNPYDTMPGLSRADLGMQRRDDGKWSF